MPASAEPLEGAQRVLADPEIDRDHFRLRLDEKLSDRLRRVGDRQAAAPRETEGRLIDRYCRRVDAVSLAEPRRKYVGVLFRCENSNDRRGIDEHQNSPDNSS